MQSALPWSAVTQRTVSGMLFAASYTLPMHASTVSTAFTAASRTPVWPTISQFAKLQTIISYLSLFIASTHFSATAAALISGMRSYVGNCFGDGTRHLSSPSQGFSTPPLKKNVTCAYFSVSATRNCS